MQSLAELQQQAGQLQARLVRAAELGQVASNGRDPSGAVEVILDSDGTASDVRIAADWRRRTPLNHVGAAVVAADTDAALNRARSFAEAIASTEDVSLDPVPAPTPVAPAVRARPISNVAESALDAFDSIDRLSTPPPAVTGTSSAKSVRISLDHGRISDCWIDPSWLARQDDTTLAHALREALASAATAQAEANRPAAEFSQRLTELLAEVKATLHNIDRGA
jgi:DNA-binding protein YbaB